MALAARAVLAARAAQVARVALQLEHLAVRAVLMARGVGHAQLPPRQMWTPEMKTCNRCDDTKHHDEYNRRNESPDGLQHTCRDCQKEYTKGYRDGQFRSKLKCLYGLTVEQYNTMVAATPDCPGCLMPLTQETRAVDHNHATGQVRGLLCKQCNIGIGNLGDDPDRLRRMARYLDIHGSYRGTT